MSRRKNIYVIIGSASNPSANQQLIDRIAEETKDDFELTICEDLKTFPHFDPQLSANNPPPSIIGLRNAIEEADGVIICTPEYVFSIPSGLKNIIEWCVVTTVFSDKPTGLITASAHGQKGHEELQLIMKTIMARFTEETVWLIQGVRGKIDSAGEITDSATQTELTRFIAAYKQLLYESQD